MEDKLCILCEEGHYILIIDGDNDYRGDLISWWCSTIGCEVSGGLIMSAKIYQCDHCGNIQICNPGKPNHR